MATITATPHDAPRPRHGRRDRMRQAWSTARDHATTMVSAARQHSSPALTIAGFTFIDLAAWETFGRGAGWLALGISILAFDWTRD